jgi:hypothetical protein
VKLSEDSRRGLISLGWRLFPAVLIVGLIIGPELLQPNDVVECEAVTVMSFHYSGRSQHFTIAIVGTDKVREVGAANAPFGHEYRGPAILALRRGRWTGGAHWRLYTSCPASDA